LKHFLAEGTCFFGKQTDEDGYIVHKRAVKRWKSNP